MALSISYTLDAKISFKDSYSHLYWGSRRTNYNDGKVTIEKNVFIGPNCVILPNVRIGEGSVIKAGTVVTKNVPPETLLGSPHAIALGRVTVPLTKEHSYEEFVRGPKPIKAKGKVRPF
jgi:serine acetyltransferase